MIIRKADVKIDTATPDLAARGFDFFARLYSETGGLTQFGALTETITPGARSSERHWHENEDEFLYMLDGTATLIEEDGERDMNPGDAAVWPKGVANGHHLVNRSDGPCTYLIIGTRAAWDRVHYSDVDMFYTRHPDGTSARTKRDGSPLEAT